MSSLLLKTTIRMNYYPIKYLKIIIKVNKISCFIGNNLESTTLIINYTGDQAAHIFPIEYLKYGKYYNMSNLITKTHYWL